MKKINDICEMEASSIYIYGAGQIAELLLLEINEYSKTKVEGIILSNTNVYVPQSLKHIDIISIENVDKEIPVIVATLSNYHQEIIEYLEENNIQQYLCVSEEFLRKMRSHFVSLRHDNAARKRTFNEMRRMAEEAGQIDVTVVSNNVIDFAESITLTPKEFIESETHRECVCILNINWDEEWQKLIIHAFNSCDVVAISYRWNYINYDKFSLFEEAEKWNHKLMGTQRIIRDREDFYTESVIFVFKKKAELFLEILYENNVLSKTKIENYYNEHDSKSYLYDIGLVGNWSCSNYGAELTYYALYSTLKDMGYTVLMIEWAEDSYKKPYGVTQLFEREPYQYYEITLPKKNHFKLREYNKCCDTFVMGSDQLLNPTLYAAFGKFSTLDWVETYKKRIGYALSFGHSEVQYSYDDWSDIKFQLSLFDAISVREDSAVNIMKELFNISPSLVVDPVFLRNKDFYTDIAKRYLQNKHSLFAYFLDPTENQIKTLNDIAKEKELELMLVPDADNEYRHSYIINNSEKISVEKWLAGIINSEFVIADSFHAMCFALIFHKEFIVVCNSKRGATRFQSLLSYLQLESHMVTDISQITKRHIYENKIDYEQVDIYIERLKEQSLQWLTKALETPHTMKVSEEFEYMQRQFRKLEARMYDERS